MIRGGWLVACALGVTASACNDPADSGARVVRTEQALDGMPIYHRAVRQLVRGDGSVVTTTGTPIDRRTPRTPARFVDDEAAAIRRAAGGAHVEQARARRFWYPYANQLVAAWVVEAYTSDPATTTSDLVRTVIAADGRILARESLVADAFTYRVFADPAGEQRPFDGPIVDVTPHPTGMPDGSYPAYVPPQDVTVEGLNRFGDPWLAPGATATSGNNVDAYSDSIAPSGLTDGDYRASATGGAFTHVYDTAVGPLVSESQQMAAITSMFYVINWLHDFWYDAGFTEAAGNAQALNYGRGGIEGDVLLAEAQDDAYGGSRNNANMATPDDGMSPRMQVYLWTAKDTRTLTLEPSGRTPPTGGAVYGPQSFDVSGHLRLAVDDGGDNINDGCTPLVGNYNSRIVLADRGNCTFKRKTTNAEAAGALGLIIADHEDNPSPLPLGEDSALAAPTIPTLSVTNSDGAAIKAELGSGQITATMSRVVEQERDGALDSTLIAHELGHYLHHRLSWCNGTAMCRALSEGWGDFTSLMLMAEPGDDLRGAFPFSVYATQSYAGDPAYFGIRRAPYSASFAINALTYRHMTAGVALPENHPIRPRNSNAEVHNAGEIWTAALWQVYVELQESAAQRGISFEDMRMRMAQYVVSGLQLVTNEANPLETRNALLAVALAADPIDHAVMIEAFARRGFGSCAVAAPRASVTFVGAVESFIVGGKPELADLDIADGCDDDSILDTGETARLTIRFTNSGQAAVSDVHLSVTSQVAGVTVLSPPTTVPRLEPFETIDLEVDVALEAGLTGAIAGDLALQVTAAGACEQETTIPLAVRFNIDDVPASSTTDTFDANASYWEPWASAWSHVRETPLDGLWHADDLPVASDTRLTSPPLVADGVNPLTITFSHRFSFEQSDDTNWDGGVIEYSVDGMNWLDVSTVAAVTYNGAIGTEVGNVLADRDAFVGTNAAWPGFETVSLDFGTALGGVAFRVRFRLGTDGATGAPGWDIDDVVATGIVGTPFPSQIADDGVCPPPDDPVDPIISGGGGCCDGGHSTNGLFALLLLVILRRRR